jgi:hypothetical protein
MPLGESWKRLGRAVPLFRQALISTGPNINNGTLTFSGFFEGSVPDTPWGVLWERKGKCQGDTTPPTSVLGRLLPE